MVRAPSRVNAGAGHGLGVPTLRGPEINRRSLLRTAAAFLLLAHRLGVAHPGRKVYRVGLVANANPVSELSGPGPAVPSWRALIHGLRALGYIEGQNLEIIRRSAEGRTERFDQIAAELVSLDVDVIVSASDRMTRSAMVASTTIPIVMTVGNDSVALGLVKSLSRPGGSVTGLTFQTGPEIDVKRLELLKAAAPAASRIAFLSSKEEANWDSFSGRAVRAAAPALGVTLLPVEAERGRYEEPIARIAAMRADALYVARSANAYARRSLIIDRTNRQRLPGSFDYRDWVEAGGLMSYGANPADNFGRAAGYVDRILHGAKPADLPVEQPTRFELVLNMKTARAIGLAVPALLQLRADEVIE